MSNDTSILGGNRGRRRRWSLVAAVGAVLLFASGCNPLFLDPPAPPSGCLAAGGVGTRTQAAMPAGQRVDIAAPLDGAFVDRSAATVGFVADAVIDPATQDLQAAVTDSDGRRTTFPLTAYCYANNPTGAGNRYYVENPAAPARTTAGITIGGYDLRLVTKAGGAFVEGDHVVVRQPAVTRTSPVVDDAVAMRLDEDGVRSHLVGVLETQIESMVGAQQGRAIAKLLSGGGYNMWIHEISVDVTGTDLDFQAPTAGADHGRIHFTTTLHDLDAVIRWNPMAPAEHCHWWIDLPDLTVNGDLVIREVTNPSTGLPETILELQNYSASGFTNIMSYVTGSGLCGVLANTQFMFAAGGVFTNVLMTGTFPGIENPLYPAVGSQWLLAPFSIQGQRIANLTQMFSGVTTSLRNTTAALGLGGLQPGVSLDGITADDHGLKLSIGTTIAAPPVVSNGTTPNIDSLLSARTTATGTPIDVSLFVDPDLLNQLFGLVAPTGLMTTTRTLPIDKGGQLLTDLLIADPAVRPLYDPTGWSVTVTAGSAPYISNHVTRAGVTDSAPRPSVGCTNPALGPCFQVMGFLNVPAATITVSHAERGQVAKMEVDLTDIGIGIVNEAPGWAPALELDKGNCTAAAGPLTYCSAVWPITMHPDTRYGQTGSVSSMVVTVLARQVLDSVNTTAADMAQEFPTFDGVAFGILPNPGPIAGADRLMGIIDMVSLPRPVVESYQIQSPVNSHHPGIGAVRFRKADQQTTGFVGTPTYTWTVDTGGGERVDDAYGVVVRWVGLDTYSDGQRMATARLTATGTVMSAQGPLTVSITSAPRSQSLLWWGQDPPCIPATGRFAPIEGETDPCLPILPS